MYDKILNMIIASFGVITTYAFGGWNEALALLAILVVFDWFTGVCASLREGYKNPSDKTKGLNSNKGFLGIFKKFLMFTVIAILYRIDSLLGLSGTLSLAVGATYFYISNELISLVENYGRLDLPMPEQFKRAIGVLKTKSEFKEENMK
ncbi:phage holin family protein [Paenibacillus sp. YPG26]|uniref:phage holin family protein n=1 Tax=Paenibacillus sp. YPG26 TaxID=2878915 RepID=UPI0020403EE9|nr:phage holin family protein [Paenibacillus sp. YPG26]USB34353.1 phage holin family protein [Paenibacillus sp. YPG26]